VPDAASPDTVVPDAAVPDATALGRWAICGAQDALSAAALDEEIEAGQIAAMLPAGSSALCAEPNAVEVSGLWLCPAFIDSHVHLAYYPVGDSLLQKGVAAAVDLGAPLDALGQDTAPLRTRWAGPMITAVGGYPTQS
jgi:cytosine/adenosine deaminase-related metal-dependent hydrolase